MRAKYRYYKYWNSYGEFYQLEVRFLRYFWREINKTFFSVEEVKKYVDSQRQPKFKYTYL